MKPSCTRAEEESRGLRATVAEIESLLGYDFRDPSLLVEAITHSSFAGHPSYQRLEFVGDAALGLAVAYFLYLTYPSLGPGPLTVLRAANVCSEKLARVAVHHRLYRFLRRNCPALDQAVNDFTDLVMMEREEDRGELVFGGNTVKAPKVLADIIESIAAAVYLDCDFNLEMLWKVFRVFLEPLITSENMYEHPVTCLHEFCQKQHKIIRTEYFKDGSLNIANVFVDGELVGSGSSEKTEVANRNAARDALQKLLVLQAADAVADLCSAEGSNGVEDEICGSKQKLHDLCSKKHWIKPTYKIEEEQGPAHNKRFICSVQVATKDNKFFATGDPKPRLREAENSAAFNMICDVLIVSGVK